MSHFNTNYKYTRYIFILLYLNAKTSKCYNINKQLLNAVATEIYIYEKQFIKMMSIDVTAIL